MVRAKDSNLEVLVHMRGMAKINHNWESVFTHQMNTLLAPGRLALAVAQTVAWVQGNAGQDSSSAKSFNDASQGSVPFY